MNTVLGLSLSPASRASQTDANYSKTQGKRVRHRQAALTYYTGHPEAREKNRLRMQERRARLRAKRRPPRLMQSQDDTLPASPTPSPPIIAAPPSRSTPECDLTSVDGTPVVEHLAIVMLHLKSTSPPPPSTQNDDSLSSSSPSTVAPPLSIRPARHVRTALAIVSQVNAAPLTPPTWLEQTKWAYTNRNMKPWDWGRRMDLERYSELYSWTLDVACEYEDPLDDRISL
ncbi:hypothetical protein R3P38DRAFT_2776496 [Favolaschia claudopus]|uniref:Uncharacterized protein n=1 Tax=Favolaschia claudopus TaxID=2862362 RepID=A0AAW0BLI6_9AGAR